MDRISPQIILAIAAEAKTAPEWVQLLPAGPEVAGQDGRTWRYDAAAVVAAFNARNRPMPLDWEHASAHRAPKGLDAPAAGWIVELAAREEGIWGRVEWTERGQAQVIAREYRFISPAFLHDPNTGQIREIVHAGLTNQPNFRMAALNRPQPPEDQSMDLSQIALALGLASNATEAQIVAKIKDNAAEHTMALNQIARPDPDKFVPKADYELALNRAQTAEQKLADQQTARLQADAEAAVEQAIADKKIAPSSREYHLATCSTADGLERFKAFAASATPIVTDSGLDKKKPGDGGGAHGLSDTELAICRATGKDPVEFAKAKAAEAA